MSKAFHSPDIFRAPQITHAGKKQSESKHCGNPPLLPGILKITKEFILESIPTNESSGESPITIAF